MGRSLSSAHKKAISAGLKRHHSGGAKTRKATRTSPRTISAAKPRVGGKGVDIFRGIRMGEVKLMSRPGAPAGPRRGPRRAGVAGPSRMAGPSRRATSPRRGPSRGGAPAGPKRK